MLRIICPSCRDTLDRQPKVWACANGHSFDVAREGYVNLLLAQQKHSVIPGDAADMLEARRSFLAAGHYDALRAAVVELIAECAPAAVLDVGCGEGYYTNAMTRVAAEVAGVDIAKAAIRMAAKRFPGATWLVASGARLPFADASLDVVCCLFSQLHAAEMQRVLTASGNAIVVTPAADHLSSVREALFEELRAHDPARVVASLATHFEPVTRREIRVRLELTRADLSQLVSMTPYAWRAKAERRALLAARDGLETVAAFSLLLLRKAR